MDERKQEIEHVLNVLFEKKELILAILTESRLAEGPSKVMIRPVLVKGKPAYQMTEHFQKQVFHHNLSLEECLNVLKQRLNEFKQTFLYAAFADYHILVGKKGNLTFLKKAPSKSFQEPVHNRQKQYLLEEGKPVPFLISLGVMNAKGQIYAAKRDKFRQINRFLEMIDDVLPHLDPSLPLHVIDFGCGKAYLTFALYHFLKFTKGYQIQLTGIDLKKDVIDFCQKLAQTLGYEESLHFVQGDIDHSYTQDKVDLVVSLHACDTATDAALEKAIRWQAKVILSVPCCQHELMKQVHQDLLSPILKHGILKERFAALATDAARVQLLEILGYQTQILEFIDVEHTPKNLLIRAVKRSKSDERQKLAWEAYLDFKKFLNIDPSLERRFKKEFY